MTRPTAIIADDEKPLMTYLRTALAKCWPDLEIIGEAHDGEEAVHLIEEAHPDIAFLDIQMPILTGIEVARRTVGQCHFVFVTAYEQYAVQAFETAAVDYLLKPVEEPRLAAAVERLKTRLSSKPPENHDLLEALSQRFGPPHYLEFLQVQHKQALVLVPVEEVQVFQSSEKYTLAITPSQEWVIRTPLKDIEVQLDPARFWKVHRNAIVRVRAIECVTRDDDGYLVIKLHDVAQTVTVSRTYAHLFRQM
jgi:DNA-binding LytR/AlgR family response regulator